MHEAYPYPDPAARARAAVHGLRRRRRGGDHPCPDLPLDGGYAYLRVEVLSRDKDVKTLEVKVLDFGDADGVNVGALPVGAQGTVDCSDLLSMAMMIDSGAWIITYTDLGQQAFPLRLTSIENPEHFAERAGK